MTSHPMMSQPHELADASIFARLHHAEEPLVIETRFDGWERPWRGFEQGDWDELAREFGERVLFATIDTGRNRSFAVRHGAEIVPQVLVFRRGEMVARFQGHAPVADVARAVREALRRDRVLDEAKRDLERALPGSVASIARSVLGTRSAEALARRLARAG